ncbi:MAG: transposase [Prolixibacteraceae bacterium]|nr:transposase [Prolixibacteraceae bacterium]
MQQSKVTEKIGEFQKFIDNDSDTGMCLEDTLKFFEIRRIFGQFESIKQKGKKVSLILTTLVVMLFYRRKNIHSYFSKQIGKQIGSDGSKNPYYDLLGNENINWRTILYLFAKRYLKLSKQISGCEDKTRALIFDDSPLRKTGKRIEGASKMHDHVTGNFLFGYKILVCGYWDGNNFIPIDFSLHRERGKGLDTIRERRNSARRKAGQAEAAYQEHKEKHLGKRKILNSLRKGMTSNPTKDMKLKYNEQGKQVSHSRKKQSKLLKKMKLTRSVFEEKEQLFREKEKKAPLYGLTPNKRRKQFKKYRDKNSPGYERKAELDIKKTQNVIKMLSRAVRKGFEFEYVLFDSWFFSKEILAHIELFRKKKIKLIAMIKMGKILYRDCLTDNEMNAQELRKKYRKKKKKSRKYNISYIKVPVLYDNRRLNLFFVKMGSGGQWRAIITNDLNITFNKLLETYQIRWSIEVFFKDMKQHLQLGKCQCNNFDSQIGATTVSMMQYIMLLLYKKMHYGNSLGGLFDLLSSQTEEENISNYLRGIFVEIINGIGKILKIDCMELIEEIIRDSQRAEEIMKFISPTFKQKLIV